MNDIYFVRHGLTSWNEQNLCQGRRDIPLNEIGLSQAEDLGKKLEEKKFRVDEIYSSPLIRAYKTADILKQHINFNKEIKTDTGLLERDFGELEGRGVQEVRDIIQSNSVQNIKGFETNEEIKARVLNSVKKIVLENPNQKIMIVAHSHTIKSFLMCISKLDDGYNTYYPNLNVCHVQFDGEKFILKELYYL